MNRLQKIFSLTSWSLWLLRDLVALFLYATWFRVLFSVWFSIQRIIKQCPGYYSAFGSVFSVLLKCPGYYSASCSGFSVLLKSVQGIIQRLVQYSAYYSKMPRLLFSDWFRIQHIPGLNIAQEAGKPRGSQGIGVATKNISMTKRKKTK